MKFLVERASEWRDEVAPCVGAYMELFKVEGQSQLIERWVIEFKYWTDFIVFTQQQERVVIDWRPSLFGLPEIIIYDDYIE